MINIPIGKYINISLFVLFYQNFHRSKYFKGKKIFADYDIRVEQVSLYLNVVNISICCIVKSFYLRDITFFFISLM